MTITTLTKRRYATLAPKVHANQEFMRNAPNPRDPATHPLPFPEVGNAETGLVEQYELHRDKPDSFFAYLSSDGRSVTTWTGDILGYVSRLSTWRDNFGGVRHHISFRMAGRDYYAQGPGKGMYTRCKAYKA